MKHGSEPTLCYGWVNPKSREMLVHRVYRHKFMLVLIRRFSSIPEKLKDTYSKGVGLILRPQCTVRLGNGTTFWGISTVRL